MNGDAMFEGDELEEDVFHGLGVGVGQLKAAMGHNGEAVVRLAGELAGDLSEHNGSVPRRFGEGPNFCVKHTGVDSRLWVCKLLGFVDTLNNLALGAKVWLVAHPVPDLGAGEVLAVLPVDLVPVLQLADPGTITDQLSGGAALRVAHVTLPAVEFTVDTDFCCIPFISVLVPIGGHDVKQNTKQHYYLG